MSNATIIYRFLFCASLMLVPPLALADSYAPSPSCSKPYKPMQFTNNFEVEQFREDVRRYKRCLQDFVEAQNNEAEYHQQAAEAAIEEWNRFVRFELQ